MAKLRVTPEEQTRFERFGSQLRDLGRSVNTLRAYCLDWQQFAVWFEQANGESFDLEPVMHFQEVGL